MVRRLFNDYGMILVLVDLCALFSLLTLEEADSVRRCCRRTASRAVCGTRAGWTT